MKDLRLHIVAVICAETPKSAEETQLFFMISGFISSQYLTQRKALRRAKVINRMKLFDEHCCDSGYCCDGVGLFVVYSLNRKSSLLPSRLLKVLYFSKEFTRWVTIGTQIMVDLDVYRHCLSANQLIIVNL